MASATGALVGAAMIATVTFVPLYVDDIDVADSSPAFLVYGIVVLVVRLGGARVPDRIGPLASGTIATSMIRSLSGNRPVISMSIQIRLFWSCGIGWAIILWLA